LSLAHQSCEPVLDLLLNYMEICLGGRWPAAKSTGMECFVRLIELRKASTVWRLGLPDSSCHCQWLQYGPCRMPRPNCSGAGAGDSVLFCSTCSQSYRVWRSYCILVGDL
jgi:hypothetical protein